MKYCALIILLCGLLACGDTATATEADAGAETDAMADGTAAVTDSVTIHPIFHAGVVLTRGEQTLFIDPYDGAERYADYGAPDLVLITHTHPDHLDSATLAGIDISRAVLVAPQAVADNLGGLSFGEVVVLENDDNYSWEGIEVAAIAMYNLPKAEDAFHPPGKFNGYVVDFGDDDLTGGRYYFAGDTEDIEEMRNLEDIDVAFVPMNLPYTMPVERAADGVLAFAPRVVYPYHYRNQDETKSDIEEFGRLVAAGNGDIEVRLEDWYR